MNSAYQDAHKSILSKKSMVQNSSPQPKKQSMYTPLKSIASGKTQYMA
jgi:hypothetical protein